MKIVLAAEVQSWVAADSTYDFACDFCVAVTATKYLFVVTANPL